MSERATIWLVINSASGSYSEPAVAALEQAFAGAGRALARTVTIPEQTAPDRAALDAAGVDILAIYTGDGTINGVVTGLYGWSGQVLALPGGTQNLLATALHGDAPAEDIVEAFGRGELASVKRHLVRTAQGDGLCEVLAGPGARWSDVREAMREGDIGGVATTIGEAIGESSGGALVQVATPALGKPDGYQAVRVYPDQGALAVDGYGAETFAEYAQQGLALLRRDFRQGPHDELGCHARVVCRSDQPIDLMIDGERKTGGREESFELRECPIEFLALNGHRAAS
ncbi:MAG: diacylglycerol kinase [Novosphingobium sp.]|nr:diacylglycerol kinase [Novosphingobium sp.]